MRRLGWEQLFQQILMMSDCLHLNLLVLEFNLDYIKDAILNYIRG